MMTNKLQTLVSETGPSATEAAAGLLAAAGLDPGLVSRLTVTGADPQLPSILRIGTAAAAAIGAASVAVTEVWRERTGRTQTVAIDIRHAAAAFRTERYALVPGMPRNDQTDRFGSEFYRTADNRFIRFHTGLPHYKKAALDVLGCEETNKAAIAAVAKWNAFELEQALADHGAIPAVVLTHEEWAQHPQGKEVVRLPIVEITKIADSPPQPFTPGERPLSGFRVIDLTRVISGPTCCRFLAGHGADVIQLSAQSVVSGTLTDVATGFGKRSAWMDLRTDLDAFGGLVDGADVLIQAMKPGVLASYGFGPEESAARRPGLIYVNLSGYGHHGPWADRPCYDTMLQCNDGIAYEEAEFRQGGTPVAVPCQAMDHATAYVIATAVLSTLIRRSREGGSYLIHVALAGTGEWIRGLGHVDGTVLADPDRADFEDLMANMETPFGEVRYLTPPEHLSETPPFYALPSAPFGTHEPVWE